MTPAQCKSIAAAAIASGLLKSPTVKPARTNRRFKSEADRMVARQIHVAEYRDQRRGRGPRSNGRPRKDRKLNLYPHGEWWKSAVQRAIASNEFYRKLDAMKLTGVKSSPAQS